MNDRLTAEAKIVEMKAHGEARDMYHQLLGTEHILLGLLHDESAVSMLSRFHITPEIVRTEVENLVERGPQTVIMGKLALVPRAQEVMRLATEEAYGRNHNFIEPLDFLAALVVEAEGVGGLVLIQRGVTIEELREHICTLQ